MNSTAENTSITWEVIDNQPIAHLSISGDLTVEEMYSLIWELKEVRDQMEWHLAHWIGAGMQGRGHGRLHILRKTDYERDKACAALCGKKPPGEWDITFILDRDPGEEGTCTACREMREFVIMARAEESEIEEDEDDGDE